MPRGRKPNRTLSEKIETINNQIAELEQKISDLKKEKAELEEEVQRQKVSAICEIMEKQNMTLEQLTDLIKNNTPENV